MMPIRINNKFGVSGWKTRRGVSLIVVLGCIVFLSALILAFLSGAKTELRTSKLYADGSSVRLLAQSAVNIVTAEISEATKTRNGSTVLTWASQPGMIRTYSDSGTATRQWFKLYSSATMSGLGVFDVNANDEIGATDWSNQPAIFTDLNQPVTVKNVDYYPIVDGNNLVSAGGNKKIYDSDSDGVPDVQGFYVSGSAPLATGTDVNPVPMPVRWLYVLANGKVVAPVASSSGSTAVISGASGSPIVGRMAFWTDDETAKININTASEGTYWDTPRITGTGDYQMAIAQPVKNEFQRYPGHPATVSLSSVFSKPNGVNEQDWKEEIYKILPYTQDGGSRGGLVDTMSISETEGLRIEAERLFVSVDELFFRPQIDGSSVREKSDDEIYQKFSRRIFSKQTLERANFFLTAGSRASDLNLFGKPRVSIWPITLNAASGNPAMSAYDSLIAFCSSIKSRNGRNIYYFQRRFANQNPAVSAASDMLDLPNTGGDTGLERNRSLLEYLRTMTNSRIPGFGSGTFRQKYSATDPSVGGTGTDCDQILLEIFDYIRCTNLYDESTGAVQYAQPIIDPGNKRPGISQVIPGMDRANGRTLRGFGRFPTVFSVSLHFIGVGDNGRGMTPPVPTGKTRVQAACYVQLFNPAQGLPLTKPFFRTEIDGLQNFKWKNTTESVYLPMGFRHPDPAQGLSPYVQARPALDGSGFTMSGGMLDFRQYLVDSPVSQRTGDAGQPVDMPSSGQFDFQGGTLTIRIYSSNADNEGTPRRVEQTVQVNIPNGRYNVPYIPASNIGGFDFRVFKSGNYNEVSPGRFDTDYMIPPITANDVVFNVVVNTDPRLVAARQNVPTSFFLPHPDITASSRIVHTLRAGFNAPMFGARLGKLVSNANYPGYEAVYRENEPSGSNNDGTKNTRFDSSGVFRSRAPDVVTFPSHPADSPAYIGMETWNNIAPDWDTGIGNERDGAYINKADEGLVSDTSSSNWLAYFGLNYGSTRGKNTFFSPNRIMPSAGMFGSLPSEVLANHPWQTLLFRPGPNGHRGLANPPDHLLLDLFNMPVVEPYAISEPLSTAGRVNMNCQIVPFTYINRDTGLRAVFKAQLIPVIPNARSGVYKHQTELDRTTTGIGSFDSNTYRWPINVDATLTQFQSRFAKNDIFRSASEICSIDLVPNDGFAPLNPDRANMDQYWQTNNMTGDNLREKPYTNIYPLLTTKSNTYTVHMRVQTLKKTASGRPDEWNERMDKITGEFRGSQTIERYVDPNNPNIPDFTADANASLDSYYSFRVVNAKQFAP
jgi:uncharacterized protein (TIGR02600 family)